MIDINDINKKLLISIINQIINKSVKDNDKKEEIIMINRIKKLNRFLLIRIYLKRKDKIRINKILCYLIKNVKKIWLWF